MDLDTLLKVVNGTLLKDGIKKKIKNIKIDSRKVKKNDLFIALIGNNFDGHEFIEEVLKKKPSCIIVCRKIDVETSVPIILVEDTYESLIKLGAFFRSKYHIPVIAVTGSYGKTTTKEIISDILTQKYKVLKSEKNYNNHIGLPLTLFKLNEKHDICILEMGMNHLGEISKLSKMVKPNIGVITNVGTAHIGNLGSQKNILKAKMEIIDGMNNGLLIVNGKNKYLKKIKYKNLIKTGIKLKPYNIIVDDKVSFKLVINNEVHKFSYNSTNKDLITNFLIAIQIGLIFKVDIEDIKKALLNYKMPKERMNIYFKSNTKIIDDCYNASFESVISAIDVLDKEKREKILVLGDILELGKYSKRIHKKIGKYLKKKKNIEVLLVGKEVKYIKNNQFKCFDNNNEVLDYLNKINLDNKTILFKGSRKMQLEKIIEKLIWQLEIYMII